VDKLLRRKRLRPAGPAGFCDFQGTCNVGAAPLGA
jgi:hypothetical protein